MSEHFVPDELVEYRLAVAGMAPGDSDHDRLLRLVAAEQISADEAVMRTCSAGGVRIDEEADFAIEDWDDYLIPGTPTLRSKLIDLHSGLGVSDPDRFFALEQDIGRIRIIELAIDPVVGSFDFAHLKSIHSRIFQDIFPWAGRTRIGPQTPVIRFAPDAIAFDPGDPAAPMEKYSYYTGPEVEEAASVMFAQIVHVMSRTDLPRQTIVDISVEYGAELQTIHPFRDGNARAFWIFTLQSYERLGFPLDPRQFVTGSAARARAIHGVHRYQSTASHDTLVTLFDEVIASDKTPAKKSPTETSAAPRKLNPPRPDRGRPLTGERGL
ncbi:hypothetical protein BH09ACT6_BH09ACT6_27610 [soil metagenome]